MVTEATAKTPNRSAVEDQLLAMESVLTEQQRFLD
jgi:hypothetical protein